MGPLDYVKLMAVWIVKGKKMISQNLKRVANDCL